MDVTKWGMSSAKQIIQFKIYLFCYHCLEILNTSVNSWYKQRKVQYIVNKAALKTNDDYLKYSMIDTIKTTNEDLTEEKEKIIRRKNFGDIIDIDYQCSNSKNIDYDKYETNIYKLLAIINLNLVEERLKKKIRNLICLMYLYVNTYLSAFHSKRTEIANFIISLWKQNNKKIKYETLNHNCIELRF